MSLSSESLSLWFWQLFIRQMVDGPIMAETCILFWIAMSLCTYMAASATRLWAPQRQARALSIFLPLPGNLHKLDPRTLGARLQEGRATPELSHRRGEGDSTRPSFSASAQELIASDPVVRRSSVPAAGRTLPVTQSLFMQLMHFCCLWCSRTYGGSWGHSGSKEGVVLPCLLAAVS